MKTIVFIYPYLTSYILPVLLGMAENKNIKLHVIFGVLPSKQGFGKHRPFEHPNISWIQVDEKHPFGNRFGMYQVGILFHIIKIKPDSILTWADPRHLSFWGILLLGRILKIRVYARGHGLFKKIKVGFFHKIMYRIILALSYRYICYTQGVKDSLLPLTQQKNKLVVDYNTLYNDAPVYPEEKTGQEKGIFYIGRVRSGCGVDALIQSVAQLNQKENLKIELHIIGDGPLGNFLVEKAKEFSWIKYYGKVFDQKKISDISRKCRLGCVPGFMGLNVVHMMSLSLPIITHSQLHLHMGPEPEYIQNNVNGWLMNRSDNIDELTRKIYTVWAIKKHDIQRMQSDAYATYELLSTPPFHERLLQIIGA